MDLTNYQKRFGIGPIGLLIGLVALGLLWLLDRRLGHLEMWSRPGQIRILGAIFIGLWIGWHCWCIRTILQWWVHGRLCTAGPYRFVRHPIYAGASLLASTGVALLFNSWIILPLPAFIFVIYYFLVRKEEAMMAAVFGEEYLHYAARTGRLFPRIFS